MAEMDLEYFVGGASWMGDYVYFLRGNLPVLIWWSLVLRDAETASAIEEKGSEK